MKVTSLPGKQQTSQMATLYSDVGCGPNNHQESAYRAQCSLARLAKTLHPLPTAQC